MLGKLRKHGVKILVFLVNILLAAVAVFVIREKDRARLSEKAEEKNGDSGAGKVEDSILPSFENSIDGEEQQSAGPSDPIQTNIPAEIPKQDNPAIVPQSPIPATSTPAPPPASKSQPANRKTKTS
jgi:hypothetical protein